MLSNILLFLLTSAAYIQIIGSPSFLAESSDDESCTKNAQCSGDHRQTSIRKNRINSNHQQPERSDNTMPVQDQHVNCNQIYQQQQKYLLYDVNDHEGFNLRRDVYIRMALLTHRLGSSWTLVLPPWINLYHWRDVNYNPHHDDINPLPWSTFFETSSMSKFVSTIEMSDFVKLHSQPLDQILILNSDYDDDEYSGEYSEKDTHSSENIEIDNCLNSEPYEVLNNRQFIYQSLWNHGGELIAKKLSCVKLQNFISTFSNFIKSNLSDVNTLMIRKAETILHDNYGDTLFWSARRSMRFAPDLVSIGNRFRSDHLESWDSKDGTGEDTDWRKTIKQPGQASGGPFLAVHLRRQDFVTHRSEHVPSIDCACKQMASMAESRGLERIFISSDADNDEWKQIYDYFKRQKVHDLKVYRFQNESLSPGQVAIVDQWIAAHAKVFIGTFESTFTFRIQEEREILGFHEDTTFLSLCPRCDHDGANSTKINRCWQLSKWRINYGKSDKD
ncbi:O-fucosyltransferase 2 [Brevipalpus obovatus]|uniref:O-fucosyltransferase 2 n=1 Tax=Brevipalpus obovatus TaxID=246614 RepID=UPI003D9E0238